MIAASAASFSAASRSIRRAASRARSPSAARHGSPAPSRAVARTSSRDSGNSAASSRSRNSEASSAQCKSSSTTSRRQASAAAMIVSSRRSRGPVPCRGELVGTGAGRSGLSGELGPGVVAADRAQDPAPHPQRRRTLVLDGPAPQHLVPVLVGLPGQFLGQPGLADPGRSGEQGQATVAGQGRRPPAEQLGQLSFPPRQLPGARGITSHITTIPARPNPVPAQKHVADQVLARMCGRAWRPDGRQVRSARIRSQPCTHTSNHSPAGPAPAAISLSGGLGDDP